MGNKYNIPESIRKSIAALLEPYGLDFERILTQAETNAASPRSIRGYCNCAAAAKYLHCSTQTIWRMVKRGIIPQHRVSGEAAPRYSYDELDSILEANTKRGE